MYCIAMLARHSGQHIHVVLLIRTWTYIPQSPRVGPAQLDEGPRCQNPGPRSLEHVEPDNLSPQALSLSHDGLSCAHIYIYIYIYVNVYVYVYVYIYICVSV